MAKIPFSALLSGIAVFFAFTACSQLMPVATALATATALPTIPPSPSFTPTVSIIDQAIASLEATITALLPTATAPPSDTPSPFIGQHIVQLNETLYCIGRGYGVRPDAIAQANNLSLNGLLLPGQHLNIPPTQWLTIPPGPVCQPQFTSPFPGLPVTGPLRNLPFTPFGPVIGPTLIPTSSQTASIVLTPTLVSQPQCIPPEFFDPLLNRCRPPDQPSTAPAPTLPPTIPAAATPTLPPTIPAAATPTATQPTLPPTFPATAGPSPH